MAKMKEIRKYRVNSKKVKSTIWIELNSPWKPIVCI